MGNILRALKLLFTNRTGYIDAVRATSPDVEQIGFKLSIQHMGRHSVQIRTSLVNMDDPLIDLQELGIFKLLDPAHHGPQHILVNLDAETELPS